MKRRDISGGDVTVATNRVRNNLVKGKGEALSIQKYFSVLLAAFVFVLGMLVGGTADAAKVTSEEINRTATVKPRLSSNETKTAQLRVHLMVENLDLHVYKKYTEELRKNAKYANVVFAKAAPGSQVKITAEPGIVPGILSNPVIGRNCSLTTRFYNHKKIGTLKELTSLGKEDMYGNKYTIPKDVEEVTATVSLTFHIGIEVAKDKKTSTGTYHQEPSINRQYYIFTSDEACKKAYDLMTSSNSVAGAISSVLGTDKKSNVKSDGKQTEKASGSKDSGGLGTAAKVAIGVVAVGAIGFGAFKLLGKGGSKGNGAGNNNNPASTSQPIQRPGAPTSNSYGQQSMQRPSAPTPNSYGQQPMQRPGAPTPNSYGSQPTQRTGAAMGSAAGPQSTRRPSAAGKNAAEAVTFCMQCGAPLRSTNRFCPNCGAKTAPEFCPECGAKLEEGSVFCGNCGMKL